MRLVNLRLCTRPNGTLHTPLPVLPLPASCTILNIPWPTTMSIFFALYSTSPPSFSTLTQRRSCVPSVEGDGSLHTAWRRLSFDSRSERFSSGAHCKVQRTEVREDMLIVWEGAKEICARSFTEGDAQVRSSGVPRI